MGRCGETTPFMEWQSPTPVAASYLGYATGWGSCGEWKFYGEERQRG